MNLSIANIPTWVSILFIFSFSTFPVYLIVNAVKSVYKQGGNIESTAIIKKIIFFFGFFFILISLVSLTGFFEKNVLPPRIIVTVAIPLFIFYQFYIRRTQQFKFIFRYIKLEQLVRIHLFRFVGVFFFLAYYYGALPRSFAFLGGGGDIFSAILVIPVVLAIRKKHRFAKTFVWIWNCIGLLDIITVLTSAIWITKQAVENNEVGVQQMATFPLSWIPAFAPATIIFLHILIFKKLQEKIN